MADRRIPTGLAESIAHLASQRRTPTLPVDLLKIAESLGVSEILTAEMTEDGRTTWVDGKPRIELRIDRPATRMRFTLAHEIAHVLIERDQTVARRTQGLGHDGVESLCDRIAASILMPRDWILRYAERNHYNLSLIRLVAHRADVSLSATAVRLAEVGGRTCMLLRFQRAPKRWVVVGHAAVPPEYHGALEATPETSSLIDSLAYRRDTWQELTLTAAGTTLHTRAHIDRNEKTCLALITAIESLE